MMPWRDSCCSGPHFGPEKVTEPSRVHAVPACHGMCTTLIWCKFCWSTVATVAATVNYTTSTVHDNSPFTARMQPRQMVGRGAQMNLLTHRSHIAAQRLHQAGREVNVPRSPSCSAYLVPCCLSLAASTELISCHVPGPAASFAFLSCTACHATLMLLLLLPLLPLSAMLQRVWWPIQMQVSQLLQHLL